MTLFVFPAAGCIMRAYIEGEHDMPLIKEKHGIHNVAVIVPDLPGEKLPVVYLNMFNQEELDLTMEAFDSMKLLAAPDEEGRVAFGKMVMVSVSDIDWNRELSPWPAERVFKQDKDFDGEGDAFLAELTGPIRDMAMEAIKEAGVEPAYEAIAGYSMAGMFSVYAAFRSPLFSRLMSASGSLWFPGFTEMLKETEPASGISRAYFSVGSKERKVRNPLTSQVEAKLLETQARFDELGAATTFVKEPGNHFVDIGGRIARGIAWMLEE